MAVVVYYSADTSDSRLAEAVLAKLAAEGLTLRSPWDEIEHCLSVVVLPTKCIRMARQLVEAVCQGENYGSS